MRPCSTTSAARRRQKAADRRAARRRLHRHQRAGLGRRARHQHATRGGERPALAREADPARESEREPVEARHDLCARIGLMGRVRVNLAAEQPRNARTPAPRPTRSSCPFSGRMQPRTNAKERRACRATPRASTGTPFAHQQQQRFRARVSVNAACCEADAPCGRVRGPRRAAAPRPDTRTAAGAGSTSAGGPRRRQVGVEVDAVQMDERPRVRRAAPRAIARAVAACALAPAPRRPARPPARGTGRSAPATRRALAGATTIERWPAATSARSTAASTCSAPPTASGPTGASG